MQFSCPIICFLFLKLDTDLDLDARRFTLTCISKVYYSLFHVATYPCISLHYQVIRKQKVKPVENNIEIVKLGLFRNMELFYRELQKLLDAIDSSTSSSFHFRRTLLRGWLLTTTTQFSNQPPSSL